MIMTEIVVANVKTSRPTAMPNARANLRIRVRAGSSASLGAYRFNELSTLSDDLNLININSTSTLSLEQL